MYSPISLQQMAVHRLTTPSPPTSPRRSPRLGLPTRKRARVSDSDQQLAPSSSKLPLTPDPSPRWIRANKRRKVLDASPPPPTTTTTPNANVSTRAGKRKSLTPNDHHELDSHHIVRKKRKENIVKDAPTANATTSLLKISVTQDTRQGGGNNVCFLVYSYFLSLFKPRCKEYRPIAIAQGYQEHKIHDENYEETHSGSPTTGGEFTATRFHHSIFYPYSWVNFTFNIGVVINDTSLCYNSSY